mmetsp:Transcript_18372/g.52290  ORF Transcript_18372/g.52290 Transcript_18372/m.52290 type:complete len:247 (+) Transcript_18372:1249-1989(+)
MRDGLHEPMRVPRRIVELGVAQELAVLDRDVGVVAGREAERVLRQQLLAHLSEADPRLRRAEVLGELVQARPEVPAIARDVFLRIAGKSIALASDLRAPRQQLVRLRHGVLERGLHPAHDALVRGFEVLELASHDDARQALARLVDHAVQPLEHVQPPVPLREPKAFPPRGVDVALQPGHLFVHIRHVVLNPGQVEAVGLGGAEEVHASDPSPTRDDDDLPRRHAGLVGGKHPIGNGRASQGYRAA